VGGDRIIGPIFRVFHRVFSEIVRVTHDPLRYLPWDCKIVSDLYDIRSSLTGIHAGLFHIG
jgi:molybdopterin-guanine dinucleotide biosynthesis protein A